MMLSGFINFRAFLNVILVWGCLTASAFAMQVESVQHGTVSFSEDELEKTFILPRSVNPDRSWISVHAASKAYSADEAALKVAADFADRRVVRVIRQAAGAGIDVAVSVVEFKHGVSVRRGVTDFPAGVYQKRIALPRIDVKNTMVFLAVTVPEVQRALKPYLHFSANFPDSHTLAIKRTDFVLNEEAVPDENQVAVPALATKKILRAPMPTANVYWQLIEFESGVKVQKGIAKIPYFSVETSAYLPETLADVTKTALFYDWTAGQKTQGWRELTMLQAEILENTQIVFKRKMKSKQYGADIEIQWALMELLGQTHGVQRGVARFSAGHNEQKIDIQKTYPGRSIVFLRPFGGMERVQVTDEEQAAAFAFTWEWVDDTQIVVRRGGSAVDAELAWSLIEFAPLTLLAPQGGEVFRVGETVEVAWDYSADAVFSEKNVRETRLVDIQISLKGGRDDFPYTVISGVPVNAGRAAWLIPEALDDKSVIGNDTVMRISLPGFSRENADQNRLPFEIKGLIRLIAPQGGERWYVGETDRKIEWEYKGRVGVLSIYYDRESGYGANPFPRTQRIARVTPGKDGRGSLDWNPIPDLSLTRARIKVVSEADESVYSISDKDFTVVPRIEIRLTTRDADFYEAGRFMHLKWDTTGTVDFFSLYYQTDIYSEWKLAQEKIPGGSAGSYSYRWLVPADAESETLRLKIAKTSDPQIFDIGPDDLGGYIAVRAWLQLNDPTAHDVPVWRPGEKQLIEWAYGGAIQYLNLEYSTDGGANWVKSAVLQAEDRRAEWVVPDASSTQFMFRLSDVVRSKVVSETQNDFEVL